MEYTKYSYQDIASRLSSFVVTEQTVRVITCFAMTDPARNRANLSLLKQFAVVPDEVCLMQMGDEIKMFPDINEHCDMTILVNAVSIDTFRSGGDASNGSLEESIREVSEKHQKLINDQVEKINQYVKQRLNTYSAEFIYLSGFSVLSPGCDTALMPDAEFLPWYLEINNKTNKNVVRQPELTHLLENCAEIEPKIQNLELLFNDMLKSES